MPRHARRVQHVCFATLIFYAIFMLFALFSLMPLSLRFQRFFFAAADMSAALISPPLSASRRAFRFRCLMLPLRATLPPDDYFYIFRCFALFDI